MSSPAANVVLVVEDEALIRMLLTDILEAAGFVVIEADGADEAIAVFAARRDVDVVVTDLRMPGTMDGLGLAGWMCEHAPAVPVIITSGLSTPPDADANPCIVHIVTKPYMPSHIVNLVTELCASVRR